MSNLSNGQDKEIKITPDGINHLVISVENKSSMEIYDLAKGAVLKMFDNPKNNIKVDEAGKLLRFSGFRKFKGSLGSEGIYDYTCELEFRDNRYKISFYDVFLDKGIKRTYNDLFNKEGELRKMEFYKTLHSNFTTMINDVNDLLKNEILKTSSDDKW